MKKLLILIVTTATMLCLGNTKTNEYYTNNGDVQHLRIGSLGPDSFVLSNIKLFNIYESKTNAQKNVNMLVDKLNISDLNTSNKINEVIIVMTNNFCQITNNISLLNDKVNINYTTQCHTNTFLNNKINNLELDTDSKLNNLSSNVYTKIEVDGAVSNLVLDIDKQNTLITNSIYILSTNKVSKFEVDNTITNVLSGMVFDISNLEKVQETLNTIISKLGGSVTNNIVIP